MLWILILGSMLESSTYAQMESILKKLFFQIGNLQATIYDKGQFFNQVFF